MDMRLRGTEAFDELRAACDEARLNDAARRIWKRLYEPFVPMDTGALKDTVTYTSRGIEHTVPYAGRLYAGGVRLKKKKHPRASARWDEAARAAGAETALRAELEKEILI